MVKRFLSAAIALVCVLAALFVYRQSTQNLIPAAPYESDAKFQDDTQTTETSDPIEMIQISKGATIGQVAGVTFTTRDKNGRIKKQSGFLKRLGNLEGLFQISRPWVKFFDYKNQRVIHITARMLTTPTEIVGGLPDTGRLEDNVRIIMFPLTSTLPSQPVTNNPNENQATELLVELG
ncbi:MAG: hypothetical protein IID32_12160 [Planctomycetes bacterium]|nr:hypothetical protein [Planctomycetota bacterium]